MARSNTSDSPCTRASNLVLPALMPLETKILPITFTGMYTSWLSRWRVYGNVQMPRSLLPELKSKRCDALSSRSGSK